ncbi:hypothetical protein BCR35DRAFT_309612 [Leucosporidium creatinivorum]|uniref:Uncharacterized protein n=1 Tax=Leucosporidium creatinivorum TaxID=106004 RepID=A0A1Y2DEJ0_9BASI|nr:hypothetical protein BCR35DRAFT_309612 [Leucosporidium creatinivorum]
MGDAISCICHGLRATVVFLVGGLMDVLNLALFAVLFALGAILWILTVTLIILPIIIAYWTLTLHSISTASLRNKLSLGPLLPLTFFHLLDNLLILGPILYYANKTFSIFTTYSPYPQLLLALHLFVVVLDLSLAELINCGGFEVRLKKGRKE